MIIRHHRETEFSLVSGRVEGLAGVEGAWRPWPGGLAFQHLGDDVASGGSFAGGDVDRERKLGGGILVEPVWHHPSEPSIHIGTDWIKVEVQGFGS